eukprot:969629-Prorocentrum_minimum.AAC.2
MTDRGFHALGRGKGKLHDDARPERKTNDPRHKTDSTVLPVRKPPSTSNGTSSVGTANTAGGSLRTSSAVKPPPSTRVAASAGRVARPSAGATTSTSTGANALGGRSPAPNVGALASRLGAQKLSAGSSAARVGPSAPIGTSRAQGKSRQGKAVMKPGGGHKLGGVTSDLGRPGATYYMGKTGANLRAAALEVHPSLT